VVICFLETVEVIRGEVFDFFKFAIKLITKYTGRGRKKS